MFNAAFFRVVPNRLGGILTTSPSVEIENNCDVFLKFQFMNLWVFQADSVKDFMEITNFLGFF
jgi:hypothetical protein